MAKKDHAEALRAIPLFSSLNDKELRSIAKGVREELFSPSAEIVKQGAGGGPMYSILEGRAEVIIDGKVVSNLGPGTYFGDIALIDQGPRTATIRAETNVRALAIASWDFLAMLEENFKLAHKVMVGLCERIRRLEGDSPF